MGWLVGVESSLGVLQDVLDVRGVFSHSDGHSGGDDGRTVRHIRGQSTQGETAQVDHRAIPGLLLSSRRALQVRRRPGWSSLPCLDQGPSTTCKQNCAVGF